VDSGVSQSCHLKLIMTKICLTGSTGGLGSRVLHHLLHTLMVPAEDIIVSHYNPSKLPEEYEKLGLDIRRGDFQSPESLEHAFRGADKLLLVSYPSLRHEVRVNAHKNAIDAALAVGVKQIYYTSLAFGDESTAVVKQAHIDTAKYLHHVCQHAGSSGMQYTIIKEGIYSESFPLYLGYFDREKAEVDRKIRVPTMGGLGVAWVGRDELGEGTARILASETDPDGVSWTNRTVLLSGSEATTLQGLADMITEVLGWQEDPLTVVGVGTEDFVTYHATAEAGPKSREYIAMWATSYPSMDAGETAIVDPLLLKLLGRPLKPMIESVRTTLQVKKVFDG
jgi:uncharacterized protein YbjT (DUF2867 family)